MPHRPKKVLSASSLGDASIFPANLEEFDKHLLRLLFGLAQLLVSHGYAHRRFSSLARIAFVDVAKAINSKSNRKVNIASIAALTGLTRVEVSRILREQRHEALGDDKINRATRVAFGWVNDPAYIGKDGKPKLLRFSAQRGSFKQLVKKYSGDIPARAMLSEMARLGMTKELDGDIQLKKSKMLPAQSTLSAIRAIAPWIDFISKAHRPQIAIHSNIQSVKVGFESMSEVLAATREMEGRWRTFMSGLRQLGTDATGSSKLEVTFSAALATAKPERRTRAKRRK